MNLIESGLPDNVSERKACEVLAICRNTFAKAKRESTFCGPPRPANCSRKPSEQPRALADEERQAVLATLNSEAYCNQPPS